MWEEAQGTLADMCETLPIQEMELMLYGKVQRVRLRSVIAVARYQTRHVVGQPVVQRIALLAAKVRQGVVIDWYATTNPPVRLMRLRQSRDPTRMPTPSRVA